MNEKKIITVSPTALNSIQSCLYQYHLGHLQGYKPQGDKDVKLEKGSFIHYLLEIYYKGIREDITINRTQLSEVVIEIGRAYAASNLALESTEIETLIDVFRLYVSHYRGESFTPLAIEEPFSTLLYEDEKYKVLFEGKLDLIVEDSGIRLLVDHKTESKHNEPKQLDNQFIGYCMSTNINTILINQITLTKTPQFHRCPISYSQKFLDEWKGTTIEWILTVLHYMEQKNFPQNFRSCYFCHFKEVCKHDFANHQGVLDQLYVKKEPHDIFGGKQ